jgi:hypothetical protein
MRWIKSAGGPLVCIARDLATKWCGVRGNSQIDADQLNWQTDYDRACAVDDYLASIGVGESSALILGDMPLETLVWQPRNGFTCIVRVFYADPGTDIIELLNTAFDIDLSSPIETINAEIRSSTMLIFDSALSGQEVGEECVEFEIATGLYSILTNQIELDDRTSTLIHKFEPQQ